MFKTRTRLEAWLTAVDHIIEHGSDLNLVLAIEQPATDGPAGLAARERVDQFLEEERSSGAKPLHTVAEWIFPGWEYRRRGLRGVFETYAKEEYPLVEHRWGSYAHRLVSRQRRDGSTMNPLESLIAKLKKEAPTPGPKKSCYEIGIAEGEYDLPLYNTVDDDHNHMGGPCLSHLSFKLYNKSIHLSAFYRSHDYRHKALGNMLGLARLQACVAREVGLPIGSLVVHSSYAFFEAGKGRTLRRLVQLVADLRQLLQESREQHGLAH